MLVLIFVASAILQPTAAVFADWNYWPSTGRGPESWGYFSGSQQCRVGRKQSPIDIDPEKLLFDPSLRIPLTISRQSISLLIVNTGLDVTLKIANFKRKVRFSGGPLAYEYQFQEGYLHWGSSDGKGSEHLINGKSFSAEMQLIGFNVQFANYSEAISKPFGIAGISFLIRIGEDLTKGIKTLMDEIKNVEYKGKQVMIPKFSIADLMPNTSFYMTYEGSLTRPPCSESVTWIISNRPLNILKEHMKTLRALKTTRELAGVHVPLIDNYRPIPASYGFSVSRPVRTNINFSEAQQSKCPTRRYIGFKASKISRIDGNSTEDIYDNPLMVANVVARITKKKILNESAFVSAIAVAALLSIVLTLAALFFGQRRIAKASKRRYAMIISLLCSNGLIAIRFFGIAVTIWVAESNSLWASNGIICSEKIFECFFYTGNVSEMSTLCVLAIYHFCFIVPSSPHVYRVRRYISAKHSLLAVWLLSIFLGSADFPLTALRYHNFTGSSDDFSCLSVYGPSYCMTLSCTDSVTQKAWWAVGLISLIIMTVCYVAIFIRIFQKVPSTSSEFFRQSMLSALFRRRGLITTVLIFISFMFCSVPYSITEAFLKITRPNPADQSNNDAITISTVTSYLQLLILLNCFLNTIIYVIRMPEVKVGYVILIGEVLWFIIRMCDGIGHFVCFIKGGINGGGHVRSVRTPPLSMKLEPFKSDNIALPSCTLLNSRNEHQNSHKKGKPGVERQLPSEDEIEF